jgi:hypothetical protein
MVLKSLNLSFLETITADVVEASRVYPGQRVGESAINTTGGVLIRPGGRDCYPAFWIRDYALSLESGFITSHEEEHAFLVTSACQADADWIPGGGGLVPRGSIPDHITFDGKAIYYPGTLDDYYGQGGIWGPLPPFDNAHFYIHMAHRLVFFNKGDILEKVIRGIPIWQRLNLAYESIPQDGETGLVSCSEANRGVSFGFNDTVFHCGHLLFPSLFRLEAALEMAEIANLIGDQERQDYYTIQAELIARNIHRFFSRSTGLLHASTGISSQPDIWASAYAVFCSKLPSELTQHISETLADLYNQGKISWKGNIRHIPVGMDFNSQSAWERVTSGYQQLNLYQNGAYWGMPVGWVCYAINQVDPIAALHLAEEYLQELQQNDYRQGVEYGSPWECMHPDNNYRQNPVYMASLTCPLGVFRKIWQNTVNGVSR